VVEAALRLGLTLGLAHASDGDHVCTIAVLLRSERSLLGALKVSLLWGLGHSATFFAVGILWVTAGTQLPSWTTPVTELAVAASLIWLGVRQWRHASCTAAPRARRHTHTFAMGLLHGLAGSAGIGLLALTTMQDRSRALGFLAFYGAGVVVGMAVVTAALSLPLAAATRHSNTCRIAVLRLAASISIIAGCWLLVRPVSP
jgi:nickel/cobalt transporter (NicO) family protein